MAEKLKRAVIYCRVSTEDQRVDNQLEVLKGWATHLEYEIKEIYSEEESAWRNGHQRELSRLMGGAYKGQFDIILVWALDRISRQGALAILEFVNKLKAWGIQVISYQEPWTMVPGELSELLYALTGWVARMESERRSERTKAGIERKKKEGWKPGRPKGSRDKRIRKRRVKKLPAGIG